MSLADTPAYCERDDVQTALQENDTSFGVDPLDNDTVDAAIYGASRWLNRQTDAHFYDSGGGNTLIDSAPATRSNIRLSVPSSPHPQDGSLFRTPSGTRTQVTYPVAHVGTFARVKLPIRYVDSIDTLEVRAFGGDRTDWVASADYNQGKDEDYYVVVDGADEYGGSYLFVNVNTLGPHKDFEDVALADVTFGLDWQDNPWTDIRRGVAHLAAAELQADDDLGTLISDEGQLVSVDSHAERHLTAAMDRYLAPYMERAIA